MLRSGCIVVMLPVPPSFLSPPFSTALCPPSAATIAPLTWREIDVEGQKALPW